MATTVGETRGDAFSMTLGLGYPVSSFIFLGIFAVVVSAQIKAKAFHPYLYWLVIIATTTLGTTMADFATLSMSIGYTGGSALLFILLLLSFAVWPLIVFKPPLFWELLSLPWFFYSLKKQENIRVNTSIPFFRPAY